MNMKRARFWRNLLLVSALTGVTSISNSDAQEGVSRVGGGPEPVPPPNPGLAVTPESEGVMSLSPSPYPPMDPGYNYLRPNNPALPPAYDTLRNSRRDAIGPRFDVGTILNDRVGVDNGEVNFNFLLPFMLGSDHEVLFVDAQGLTSYTGRGAASAGVGYRFYDSELNRLFGISGWVDYDTGHNKTYQQAGISFESLGTWMDLRVNGYLPFGTDSNELSRNITGTPFLGPNGLLVNQRVTSEAAFHGLDAEMGGPVPILGRYGINGYVGGYWLASKTGNSKTSETAAGPRVRFEANVTDSFRVNVTASNDQVFGTNAWVGMQWSLPDGRARTWFRPKAVEDKMLMTVNRSYRVQTHTRTDNSSTPVLFAGAAGGKSGSKNAGLPISIIYVDPDAPATGANGTLAHPYNSLTTFTNIPTNGFIVLDGSPTDKPINGNNLKLFNDQKLLSTAVLAAGGITVRTNLGNITLPPMTGFGDAVQSQPIFSNPSGGNLVTLAGNNTEVAGITFDGATKNSSIPNSNGIVGNGITNFNIHHNAFINYHDGVALTNANGIGLFQSNTMTGLAGVSNDGFRVTNSGPTLAGAGALDLSINGYTTPTTITGTPTVVLSNSANLISDNDGAGVRVTARNRAEINAHVVGNTVKSNGDGVVLEAAANRGVIHASVVGNTLTGNRGEDRNGNGILDPGEDLNGDGLLTKGIGLTLLSNTGTIDAATIGEDANHNGILDAGEDANNNGLLDGGYLITGNTITKNTGDGIAVNGTNNGNANLIVTQNLIGNPSDLTSGNGGRGLSITGDSGIINAQIGYFSNEDSNFNGQLDAGEDLNGNGTLDIASPADGNFFIANQAGGLLVDLSGTATGNIATLNNVIGNGNGSLIFAVSGDTTGVPFTITNSSQRGINLNNLTWDLLPANLAFNTLTTNANGQDFTVSAATVAATGFTSVNGVTDTTSAAGATALVYPVADQARSLAMTYNGFTSYNGILDSTEDTNKNGKLDSGEDLNNNGRLDSSEDTNNNGKLDPGEDKPKSFAFAIDVDGFPAAAATEQAFGNNFIGATVNATFSSGHALSGTFQAIPGTTNAAQFIPNSASGVITNLVTGPGIEMRASGTSVLNNPTIVGNDVRFQQGGGIKITATEDAQIKNVLIQNNIVESNGSLQTNGTAAGIGVPTGGGISVNTLNAQSANITGLIENNAVSNNIGAGISLNANSGSINILQLDSNTLSGNTNGISLSTLNNGTISTRITNNTISGSTADGFITSADTGSITLNQFTGNVISSSGGNGLVFGASNGGTLTIGVTEDINRNGLLDLGEDVNGNGVLDLGFNGKTEDINNNGTLDPSEDINNNGILDAGEDTNGNGKLDLSEDTNGNGVLDRGNLLFGNKGNGLLVTGTGGIFNLGSISGLTIDQTLFGTGGFVIDTTDSVVTGQFIGNTLTANSTNTTLGTGFSLTATNGTFDVSIGGPNAADGNNFQGNHGAGIAILAQNRAVGSFHIENNLITGTVDDANAATPYSGQGIYIGLRSQGTLTPATAAINDSTIFSNTIGDATNTALGNVGGGILVQAGEQTKINGLTIDGNLISSNGPTGNAAGNSTNIVNGITFLRTDDAAIEGVLISNNQIRNNTFDGIYLHALGGVTNPIDITLQGNTISNNAFNGINLRTEADAILNTTITNNVIENNGANGILMTSFEVSAADEESQTGVWTGNTIRRNALHGIEISTISGVSANPFTGTLANPLTIGLNGTNPIDGRSLGNLITDNGQDGIEINAPGDLEINNNMIARNGNSTTLPVEADGLAGIDINNSGSVGEFRLRLTNNTIQNNTGDGFEVLSQANFAVFTATTITALGNTIDSNTGRGIDLLNAGDAYMNFRLGDGTLAGTNVVSNNGLEGIYVVNTPSTTQAQNNSLDQFTLSSGSNPFDIAANMILDINGNRISGNNNLASTLNGFVPPGAGLVVHVGSENASQRFTGADATGDLFGSGFGDFSGNGVGSNNGDSMFAGNGRVNARVINNTFQGNLGDDVYFDSFNGTAAPPNSAGTWSATQFTVNNGFRQDPLARLNLTFNGNTGNSLNVTNVGAFYNNAEGTFKSRLNNATPPGPFQQNGGDTRRRNAQRIAFRGDNQLNTLPPTTGPDVNPLTGVGIFEYAGMGASTFRIESNFDTSGFNSGDTFFTDSNTGDPVFDANGIFFGNSIFGEQPYGWGTATPGTFTFDTLNSLFP